MKECNWSHEQFKRACTHSWEDHFTWRKESREQETQTSARVEVSYDSISRERELNLRRELENEKDIFMREQSARIREEEYLKC